MATYDDHNAITQGERQSIIKEKDMLMKLLPATTNQARVQERFDELK